MGNMHYQHHKQLKAPMVDVHTLSTLLRQLDFKVVSLLDLCKTEMQMAVNEFLLLLDKGVYGAAASPGAAPARGEPGGFVLVGSWVGGSWARSRHRQVEGCHLLPTPSSRFALLRRARL